MFIKLYEQWKTSWNLTVLTVTTSAERLVVYKKLVEMFKVFDIIDQQLSMKFEGKSPELEIYDRNDEKSA
jgi:hypothetical protein